MTLSGLPIEKARWDVNSSSNSNISVGHPLSICIRSQDKKLLAYLERYGKNECSVGSDNVGTYILAQFSVKSVSHMIDELGWTTLITASPVSKMPEQTVLYIMAPERCDARYLEAFSK